jgi:hypothetical protein
MKNKIFTVLSATVLSAGLLFTSCSKDALDDTQTSRSLGEIDEQPSSLASTWESAGSWSAKDSSGFRVFSFNRALPGVTSDIINNGVVKIWTKYAKMDATTGLSESPAELPFFIYSENERPKFVEYWETQTTPGNVKVTYRTTDQVLIANNGNPNAKVQFRYFVIPASELSSRNLTRDAVNAMTYQQLVNAFGVSQ